MSWLKIPAESHFSLNNTPLGIISIKGAEGQRVGATRYGDYVVDLSLLEQEGLLASAFKGSEGSARFNQVRYSPISLQSKADLSELDTAYFDRLCCSPSLDSHSSSARHPASLRFLFFDASR